MMSLPFHWRVTRYDPALRNDQGHYPLGDWSSFSDVGKIFNGQPLTFQQYLPYETAYVHAAIAFLSNAGLDDLQVVYLENREAENFDAAHCDGISLVPALLQVGSMVGRDNLADIVRLNLREVLWCKLEAEGRFYLHFGWDFYMYIGSISPSAEAIHVARTLGLFVEPMTSPYL